MAEFALCLTHDVDRPYKTYQAISDTLVERDPARLRALSPHVNPYWQFDTLMQLEEDFGVRSALYFLSERGLWNRSPREWLRPRYWLEHLGRYDVSAPRMAKVIRNLDAGGWEVGLHGSYDSYDDRERLATEKGMVERVLGHRLRGGRQHFLNRAPATWDHHRAIGLEYDSSLGSSIDYGFTHGYDLVHPFDDEFTVFPLTLMEVALFEQHENIETAWNACEELLAEAAANDAVMTVLWHPRYLSGDFPGYRTLYRRLIERALELGAWVGPPADCYDRLVGEGRTVAELNRAANAAD
ncbi:polysaccharide deacetylase family protein [Halococcus sediminicola]|uniref:polysaccharide deacetylase family protein n=1 Tax=Halococcus sediminicola TaxID=1264579 RepID=UPI000678DB52|nr:polysaccharide deacetylase family protein [Halococcus sediminicola]